MYFENGQLSSSGHYIDDKRVGLHEDYYENGQLNTSSNYKDGELDGLSQGVCYE